MKAEPLKDKGIQEIKEVLPGYTCFAQAMKNGGKKIKQPTGKLLFHEDHIRSAIEWLKLRILHFKKDKKYQISRLDVIELIAKAFPDLKRTKMKGEPLKGKLSRLGQYDHNEVKAAVSWYKKYFSYPELLVKKRKDLIKDEKNKYNTDFIDVKTGKSILSVNHDNITDYDDYNEWLLDQAFPDLKEEKE